MLVAAGLCSPNGPNGGYDKYGKQQVNRYLRQVEREAYRSMHLRSSKLIAHARIPVLKLETRNGTELDISINDASGVSAANFLQSWVRKQGFLVTLCGGSNDCLASNVLGQQQQTTFSAGTKAPVPRNLQQ